MTLPYQPYQPHQLYQQHGFSLIEVLITTVILATGILSITGLQLSSIKNSHNTLLETQAHYMATTLLNQSRDNPQGLTSYLVDGSTYACSAAPTPNCISTATNTLACTATELATSEIYYTICGNTVSTTVNGGVKNELPSASMTIQCIATDGTFGNDCSTRDVSVSVSWGERDFDTGTSVRTLRITGSI